MKVSYNKLWKLLFDRNMKKMDVLRRIREYLQCDVGDIMEMISEKDEE